MRGMGLASVPAAVPETTLATHGVTLFESCPPEGPRPPLLAEYERLLGALVAAGARLQVAVPCLLAVHDGEAARVAVLGAAEAGGAATSRLGLLYRVARALLRARAPDLEFLLGRRPVLPPLAIEPPGVDPTVRHGEAALAELSERARSFGEPDVAGGAARAFDTWLRLAAVDRLAALDRRAVGTRA
jgi:hypothetical protein